MPARGEARRGRRPSAGRSRAWTSGSASPPGAHASSGRRRHVARTSPQRASISERWSPSHSPWPISMKPGSGRTGTTAPSAAGSAIAAAIAPAVAAVRESGEWTISSGGAGGTGSAGGARGTGEPRRRRGGPGATPSGESGVSAWPWKRPSTINSTRRGGRGRASRRARRGSRPAGVAAASPARSPVSARVPSRIVHRSMTESWARIASATAGRHVVVEGEDHQRVGARRGPPDVHRADVHVGLAERLADPPDHPRPVAVVGDQHDLGRVHVEAVVVEPGEPGLAAGDRAADRRRPAGRLARTASAAPRTRRRRASCARRP